MRPTIPCASAICLALVGMLACSDSTEPTAAPETAAEAGTETGVGGTSALAAAPLAISNVKATSGKSYLVVANGLTAGARQYIDRSSKLDAPVPSAVQGLTYIQTAYGDRQHSPGSASFLTFDVNQNVVVYVAHDDRGARPAWLKASFRDAGVDLVRSGIRFSLFERSFSAGRVALGSNTDAGTSASMYTVAVKPAPTQPAPTPPPPSDATGVTARQANHFFHSVGVATHLTYLNTPYGAYPSIKARLLELGVRHIRDGGWSSDYYTKVKDLAANGIKVLQVCDPRQVTADACYQNVKTNLLNAVSGVEGPNEYDLSGAGWETRLRSYLQRRSDLFRADATTRSIPLVGTAFVGWQATTAIGNVSTWVDRANMHPLRYFPPDGIVNQTSQNIVKEVEWRDTPYGEKPMVASETGYFVCPYGDGVSERAQSKYLPRMFLAWFNAGVVRTYIYEFWDEGASLNASCETRMGIVRYDGSVRPAFTAIKNLLTLVKDEGPDFTPGKLNYTLSGDLTNVQSALFQKRDGRFYLMLWLAVSSYNVYGAKADLNVTPRNLTLRLPSARTITQYRPTQGATPAASMTASSLSLSVPDEVLVVEVR